MLRSIKLQIWGFHYLALFGNFRIAMTAGSFFDLQEFNYLPLPLPLPLPLFDPGQMNTVFYRKFTGHSLKSKAKPVSA